MTLRSPIVFGALIVLIFGIQAGSLRAANQVLKNKGSSWTFIRSENLKRIAPGGPVTALPMADGNPQLPPLATAKFGSLQNCGGQGQPSCPGTDANVSLGEEYRINVIGGVGGVPALPVPLNDNVFNVSSLPPFNVSSLPEAISNVPSDEVSCPTDQVMVGVKVRSGEVIDAIKGIYCKPILKLSDVGASPIFVSAGFGGDGGHEADAMTVSSYALTGFATKVVQTVQDSGIFVIGELQAFGKIVDTTKGVLSYESAMGPKYANGGDYPSVPLKCPDSYVLKGLMARHGNNLDALGVVCQKVYPSGQNPTWPAAGLMRLGQGYEMPLLTISTGGSYFEKRCPENMAIVGFAVKSGDALDQLTQIACLDINDVANRSGATPQMIDVEAGGSSGSAPMLVTAPEGYAMYGGKKKDGYQVDSRFFAGIGGTIFASDKEQQLAYVVKGFIPEYAGIYKSVGYMFNDTQESSVTFGKGFNGTDITTWPIFSCPEFYVLTGVKGRAGKYLDAFTGICQRVEVGHWRVQTRTHKQVGASPTEANRFEAS